MHRESGSRILAHLPAILLGRSPAPVYLSLAPVHMHRLQTGAEPVGFSERVISSQKKYSREISVQTESKRFRSSFLVQNWVEGGSSQRLVSTVLLVGDGFLNGRGCGEQEAAQGLLGAASSLTSKVPPASAEEAVVQCTQRACSPQLLGPQGGTAAVAVLLDVASIACLGRTAVLRALDEVRSTLACLQGSLPDPDVVPTEAPRVSRLAEARSWRMALARVAEPVDSLPRVVDAPADVNRVVAQGSTGPPAVHRQGVLVRKAGKVVEAASRKALFMLCWANEVPEQAFGEVATAAQRHAERLSVRPCRGAVPRGPGDISHLGIVPDTSKPKPTPLISDVLAEHDSLLPRGSGKQILRQAAVQHLVRGGTLLEPTGGSGLATSLRFVAADPSTVDTREEEASGTGPPRQIPIVQSNQLKGSLTPAGGAARGRAVRRTGEARREGADVSDAANDVQVRQATVSRELEANREDGPSAAAEGGKAGVDGQGHAVPTMWPGEPSPVVREGPEGGEVRKGPDVRGGPVEQSLVVRGCPEGCASPLVKGRAISGDGLGPATAGAAKGQVLIEEIADASSPGSSQPQKTGRFVWNRDGLPAKPVAGTSHRHMDVQSEGSPGYRSTLPSDLQQKCEHDPSRQQGSGQGSEAVVRVALGCVQGHEGTSDSEQGQARVGGDGIEVHLMGSLDDIVAGSTATGGTDGAWRDGDGLSHASTVETREAVAGRDERTGFNGIARFEAWD